MFIMVHLSCPAVGPVQQWDFLRAGAARAKAVAGRFLENRMTDDIP
jgi:hypothetical protein